MPDTTNNPGWVSWRPITEGDGPALFRIYASTREAELAILDWTEAQKHDFLVFQFNAQHTHYTTHFPGANFGMLEMDGAPIGRLYVRETPQGIHILDIALLPEFRGRGIGSGLLEGIQRRADAAGLPVSIYVEMNNPARHLYQRLGFHTVEDQGMYSLLEYRALAAIDTKTEEALLCP